MAEFVQYIVPFITFCIAVGSFVYTVKNSKRDDTKDIVERATADAKVNVKLDSISSTLTDIKYDISTTKREVSNLSTRLTTLESNAVAKEDFAQLIERLVGVEQSTKSAHKRIDNMERGTK